MVLFFKRVFDTEHLHLVFFSFDFLKNTTVQSYFRVKYKNVANIDCPRGEINIVLCKKRFPKKVHLHMSIILASLFHCSILFFGEP